MADPVLPSRARVVVVGGGVGGTSVAYHLALAGERDVVLVDTRSGRVVQVNNGFFYNAFVANLNPAQTLQPFFDWALGFRRGVDAGQPPDNAGPRAEFPWPRNASPPGGGAVTGGGQQP